MICYNVQVSFSPCKGKFGSHLLMVHSTGYIIYWVLVSAWVCVTMGSVYFTSAKGRGDGIIFDPCIVSWWCCLSPILGPFLPQKKEQREREREIAPLFNLHLLDEICPDKTF